MPHLRVELDGPVDPTLRRRLLGETAELLSALTGSPLARVRSQVLEYGADTMAVGGTPVSESGRRSPLIWVHMLEGRPAGTHREIIAGLANLVAAIVGVPVGDVRVFITEFPPQRWGIGAQPAAPVRRNTGDPQDGSPAGH